MHRGGGDVRVRLRRGSAIRRPDGGGRRDSGLDRVLARRGPGHPETRLPHGWRSHLGIRPPADQRGSMSRLSLRHARWSRPSPTETDEEALATVGVVAATLLEDALAREELQELDVRKSEYLALATHELRNPLSSIYGISVTLNEREDELAEAGPQGSSKHASRAGGSDADSGGTAARPVPARPDGDPYLARARSPPAQDRGAGPLAHGHPVECGDGRGSARPAGGGGPGSAGSDALEPDREFDCATASPRSRSPRSARTGTSESSSRIAVRVFRMSSCLACSTGSRAAPNREAVKTAPDWVSRSPRHTLELTVERSSTGPRCRMERDSRS